MTKECKQQFTLRITQANSTQLIVILYEMTLQYLADGEQAADDAGLAEAVHRARGCIKELLNSLHREYSPAGELSRLYLFCLRRLAVCEVRRDRTILEEIRKVIAPLCDAYRQIQAVSLECPSYCWLLKIRVALVAGLNPTSHDTS